MFESWKELTHAVLKPDGHRQGTAVSKCRGKGFVKEQAAACDGSGSYVGCPNTISMT